MLHSTTEVVSIMRSFSYENNMEQDIEIIYISLGARVDTCVVLTCVCYGDKRVVCCVDTHVVCCVDTCVGLTHVWCVDTLVVCCVDTCVLC